MKRATRQRPVRALAAARPPEPDNDSSLLDVVDSLLNKGVVVNGDLVLGVAKVDLIYAKLSVLLAALDRVMGNPPAKRKPAKKLPRRSRSSKSP